MTKGGALALAVVCALLMIVFYSVNVPICGTVFLAAAIIPGGIWLYKFQRDQHIIEAAHTERLTAPSDILSGPPLMTSPESTRLFVPEPLNERR